MVVSGSGGYDVEMLSITSMECTRLQSLPYNRFAYLTSKGLEILTLDASCITSQRHHRELIRPSLTSSSLHKWIQQPTNRIAWCSNLKDFKQMCLQTEGLPYTTVTPYFSLFTAFECSPIHHNECYLATILSSGAVVVYQYTGSSWSALCDVTDIWVEECSKEWSDAVNYEEWRAQLVMGKPAALVWLQQNSSLYLVMCTLNGTIAVFEKEETKTFRLSLKTKFSSGVGESYSVHVMPRDGDLIVFVTSFNGQVTACHLQDWKLTKTEIVVKEIDLIEAKNVVVLDNQLYINKTQYLMVLTVDGSGVVLSQQVDLRGPIHHISTTSGYLYAVVGQSLTRYHVPELTEINTWPLSKPYSFASITSNGEVAVFATSANQTSKIYVYSLGCDPLDQLCHHLRAGPTNNSLMDNLDLLWLRKVSLVNKKSAKTDPTDQVTDLLQLQYWEDQLQLTMLVEKCTGVRDGPSAEMRQRLEGRLQELQIKLATLHFGNESQLSAALLAITGSNDSATCILCSGQLVKNTVKCTRCVDGHTVARCVLTLQPCTTPYYRSCQLCSAVAVSTPDSSSVGHAMCYLCSGHFKFNVNLR